MLIAPKPPLAKPTTPKPPGYKPSNFTPKQQDFKTKLSNFGTSLMKTLTPVPRDDISDKQIDTLIQAAGVIFPPFIKDKLRFYVKKNWAARPGKKSALELFRETSNVCTQEYFSKFVKGDANNQGWAQRLNIKIENLKEIDPVEDKQTYDDIKESIEIEIEEVSKMFTEGFTVVFKDNLIFENGRPIGIREGDDRQRFAKCHQYLNDQYQRSKVTGLDPESTFGLGRKRKTKKSKKNKKRKTHRYIR
jgi:hypothetical protein